MCHACSIHLTARFILLSKWSFSSMKALIHLILLLAFLYVLADVLDWDVALEAVLDRSSLAYNVLSLLSDPVCEIPGHLWEQGFGEVFWVFSAGLCSLCKDKICIAELETHYLNSLINIVRMCVGSSCILCPVFVCEVLYYETIHMRYENSTFEFLHIFRDVCFKISIVHQFLFSFSCTYCFSNGLAFYTTFDI